MKTKLILLSTILLFSCAGTRKVNKSDTKEETQIAILDTSKQTETKQSETNTNVKETKSTTIDKENNIVSDVTEITPDDKTKPASVKLPNGQIIDITNAKYRNEKKTDLSKQKVISLSEYELLQKDLKTALKINESITKENIELKKQLETKQVEKQQFNYGAFILSFWWLWLIIILGIYIGWKNRKTFFV